MREPPKYATPHMSELPRYDSTPVLDIGVYGARGIPSTYSGYETFLTVMLPALAARGHVITMYCRRGDVEHEHTYEGVKKRFLPSIESKALSTLSHGAIAAFAARSARHDVVLVLNVANAGYCAIHRWTGQPVVLNVDGQEWLRGKWGRTARRFFKLSALIARRTTTALIADCSAMQQIYHEEFAASSTVVPYCWTDLTARVRSEGLGGAGLKPGQYFCQAGRLNPENNAVPLAQAFARSKCKWPLVILGGANYDSPVRRELEDLARRDDRIRLLGHIDDRATFAGLVQNAGAYLHGHSVGGINPSLLEAMGIGALIVALDTVFNLEALGDAGLYFHDFDASLTSLLESLPVMSAQNRDRLRQQASERVRATYSAGRVVKAYETLLIAAAAAPWRSDVTVSTDWGRPTPHRSATMEGS